MKSQPPHGPSTVQENNSACPKAGDSERPLQMAWVPRLWLRILQLLACAFRGGLPAGAEPGSRWGSPEAVGRSMSVRGGGAGSRPRVGAGTVGMAHSLAGIKTLANVKTCVICFAETGCLFVFGRPVSRTRLGPSQTVASTETHTDGGAWGLGMKAEQESLRAAGSPPPHGAPGGRLHVTPALSVWGSGSGHG